MSNMEMYVAEMSSDSFQLWGMAERGMLHEFFGKKSRYGTPLIGILFSAIGELLLSWLSFQEIVAAEKFLVLFRNDFGIPSICMVTSKTSICISALQDTRGNNWSDSYVYSSNYIDLHCVGSFYTQGISCKYVERERCGNWPCDAALSQVCGERWIKFSVSSDLPDLHGSNQASNDALID